MSIGFASVSRGPRAARGLQGKLFLALACSLAGCATAGSTYRPGAPTVPAAGAEEVPEGARVTCEHAALTTTQGTRDTNMDATSVFAVLTLPEANVPPPKHPVSFKVQVQRSRVDEPSAEAGARSDLICAPEGQAHVQSSGPVPPG